MLQAKMERRKQIKVGLKKRGENWLQEDKDIFLEIMRSSVSIIENKNSDSNTNKKKYDEWVLIQKRIKALSGKNRDIEQLKGFWKRCKMVAKRNIMAHKMDESVKVEGRLPPTLSYDDELILNMCPPDLLVERNKYDSDGPSTYCDELMDSKRITTADDDGCDYEDSNEDTPRMLVEVIETPPDEIQTNGIGNHTKTNENNTTEHQKKSSREMFASRNQELKELQHLMMEEEHAVKMKYHQNALTHQDEYHKQLMELLELDKKKKLMELKLLELQLPDD